MRRPKPAVTRTLALSGFVLLWDLAPRLGLVSAVFLASPLDALAALVREREVFWHATIVTLRELGPALVIACGLGLFLGLIVATVKPLGFLRRYVGTLYAIPLVILYPLLTVWLGFGSSAKIVFGGLYGMIPMMLTTAAAVSTVDQHLVRVATSLGASRGAIVSRVLVPLTLPGIFAGLRVGSGLAMIGVIVAQLLASTQGLGFVLTANRTTFNVDMVYAAVLIVLVLAYALNRAFYWLEVALSPWPKGTSQSVLFA